MTKALGGAMNITALLAIVGSITWILSEIVERASDGYSTLSLVLTAVAFGCLAVGVWSLNGTRAATRLSRGLAAVASLSFALMAVAAGVMMSGADGHEGPIFGVAIVLFLIGNVGLAVESIRSRRHVRWAPVALLVSIALILIGQGAEIALVSSIANTIFSLAVIAMAAPQLRTSSAAGELVGA